MADQEVTVSSVSVGIQVMFIQVIVTVSG